ncbi:Protein of unknown function [Plasmodium yoelii yoelii]|uniref:Memo-like protein n=1 Tax=Plasmodium yoelii yoelii TaxID=73239 RepID=Q7RG18_PLAYO|nr:Protein of unknown function [Plasmodium yoelii yoelii]
MPTYRRAYHSGSWYSDNSNVLKNSIESLFEKINLPKQQVKAAICPHAGYAYCLETSSHVYSCINVENIKNIFILGPNHHIYNKGCLLPQVDKYETPFGFLQINKDGNLPLATCHLPLATYHLPLTTINVYIYMFISDIMNNDTQNLYDYIDEIDDEEEHSIEMQLPLIKYIIKEKDIKIVPIYVGCIGNDVNKINEFSNPLKKYFQDKTNAFIFSSDFCHFGRRFSFTNILEKYNDKYIHKKIENMDKDGINVITKHNVQGYLN